MLEFVHRVGSAIRHSPKLQEQAWLWKRLEPFWQAGFERLSRDRGYATHLNGDIFRLEYALGARYDRQDHRVYEPRFYRSFVRLVRPGMNVFDVGAHFGVFTLAAAKRIGAQGQVYAFEPSEQTVKVLERHVYLNRWQDRVTVIRAAVADAEGTVAFYTYGTSMAASLGRENVETLNPERPEGGIEETKVASITLDAFCQARNVSPDLIKIDVEGAELLVLRGATTLLMKERPTILCEVHPKQMESCGCRVVELEDYVASIGYSLTPLDHPNAAGIFHALLVSESEPTSGPGRRKSLLAAEAAGTAETR